MRVAFDITPQLSGATGIARYLTELTAALERAGVEIERFAFGRATAPLPAGTRRIRVPARLAYPIWRRAGIPPTACLARGADLVHGGPPGLPPTRVPLVATVHDLDALEHPELHPRRSARALGSLLATLDRARMVIAVSGHVAGELAARGIDRERIAVIHHGVPTLADPVAPTVEGPFVLAVGRLMPRKGFDLLLRAFARAALEGLDEHRLVIAGPPGIQAAELRRQALRLGVGHRVRFTGAVEDGELAGLYRAASVVCVPSVAEGFGLPVLEALAAGAPVICSELPVFREVSGGRARFVTGDEREWARALLKLVARPPAPAELEAGRAWAAAFTWDRAAAETIAVYSRALPRPGG